LFEIFKLGCLFNGKSLFYFVLPFYLKINSLT